MPDHTTTPTNSVAAIADLLGKPAAVNDDNDNDGNGKYAGKMAGIAVTGLMETFLSNGTPERREIRTLRYELEQALATVKAERRAHGVTQATVYRLRCELAEARGLVQINPSNYRGLMARANRYGRMLADSAEQIAGLKAQVRLLEAGGAETETVKAITVQPDPDWPNVGD